MFPPTPFIVIDEHVEMLCNRVQCRVTDRFAPLSMCIRISSFGDVAIFLKWLYQVRGDVLHLLLLRP